MSKVLYVCSRNQDFKENIENKLVEICNQLVPDNIESRPQNKVYVKGDVAYAVTMSNGELYESDSSIILGFLYEKVGLDWHKPKQNYPDGNYAMFRNAADKVEVVSDFAGSRTIWYYHDNEIFVASTSQRAIVMFLGNFSFDVRIIPWVLSTGSLGPLYSWDKRIKRLQADSSVLLSKNSWELSENVNSIIFSGEKRRRGEHKELLTNAIRRTIKHLKSIDLRHWVIPLSGGYDSRAILCFIKEQISANSVKDLKAVTWGLEKSLSEEGNDAKIAKELAHSLKVKHDYYHTDLCLDSIESIIDRFILCSEGRIDHIAGYMDGMEIWKKFNNNNIVGVIRGDEGFGWAQVSSELTVRFSVGCPLCTDFENLKDICEDFDFPTQQFPSQFQRSEKESLSEWRDRLYHIYRIPTILAALSDIKFSYVEQINPLLSKAILNTVRTIPDNLRTDKHLFKEIVQAISPSISYANKSANAVPKDILKTKSFVNLLKNEINSNYATQIFGSKFVKFIDNGINENKSTLQTPNDRLKNRISSFLPQFIKNLLRDSLSRPRVDNNILAFRVFTIIKMHKFLNLDAIKLSS